MPSALSIAPALILTGVLIASAVGKLRHPDDLAGWAELGVPGPLRRTWLLRAHPWAELALGAALAALGGVLGLLAAIAATALFGSYTWLVWRRWSRARAEGRDASCACFGEPSPITGVTVIRNAWLLLLSAAALSASWTTPLFGGPLAAAQGAWEWIVALAAAALTAALVSWRSAALDADLVDAEVTRTHAAPAGSPEEPLEYVRTRTPAVPVSLADGTTVNLRTLARRRPILLLAVSETCGACEPVIESVPRWRELLPEVDLRLLLHRAPDATRLTETDEPQSMHDVNGYVRGSIDDWATPTAVLVGTDGLLAGGPVSGPTRISAFIDEVYESLHGERPPSHEA